MSEPELVLTDQPPDSFPELLGNGIMAVNEASLGPSTRQRLAIQIRNGGQVVGGLLGRTSYKRLFVELLFVPESLRGRGLGASLLDQAEAEAQRRGCVGAWLETFSARARGFYVANGYRVFGEIPDYPPGNTRFFLVKDFAPIG